MASSRRDPLQSPLHEERLAPVRFAPVFNPRAGGADDLPGMKLHHTTLQSPSRGADKECPVRGQPINFNPAPRGADGLLIGAYVLFFLQSPLRGADPTTALSSGILGFQSPPRGADLLGKAEQFLANLQSPLRRADRSFGLTSCTTPSIPATRGRCPCCPPQRM